MGVVYPVHAAATAAALSQRERGHVNRRTAAIVSGKTLVIIATYNEAKNLPVLVPEIFRHLPEADLLVVDDDSPDGTGAWCDALAAAEPRLRCVHRRGKLGLGSAIVLGLKCAIERRYEFAINMDADLSHDPRYLPELVEGMNRAGPGAVDVMIGSRYVPGGAIEGWHWKRHVMSRAINLYSRALLGLRSKDCSGGYRCFRTSRLAQLDFDSIVSNGYSFHEELLWRLKQIGCRIDETPITFVDRINGDSKINPHEAWDALRILATLGSKNLLRRNGHTADVPGKGN
ncbi:MAG TPA: polyprenol monophosphomannose synthase [Pirellulales bacterium]|jgi:dolichol-phosphate mannosyltransferase|nr:polyprenol monophosphomannose synthase [Pirellulales bacterium]